MYRRHLLLKDPIWGSLLPQPLHRLLREIFRDFTHPLIKCQIYSSRLQLFSYFLGVSAACSITIRHIIYVNLHYNVSSCNFQGDGQLLTYFGFISAIHRPLHGSSRISFPFWCSSFYTFVIAYYVHSILMACPV